MAGSKTQRLDALIVERGLAESRARAQSLIMGGAFTVNGVSVTKPAQMVARDAHTERVTAPLPYVSRGGLKLRHALDTFKIPMEGAVAMDVGASTGGFTDVLLQAGAARVYAIDAGYGQLAWSLRQNPRVTVMERTNIRHLLSLPQPIDLAVIDTSFISLRLVLPRVAALLKSGGRAIPLIKPQFEAGRAKVKKGVVRDPAVWSEVLGIVLTAAEAGGWTVRGLTPSPIRGPAGNVEFLASLVNVPDQRPVDLPKVIADVVEMALGGNEPDPKP